MKLGTAVLITKGVCLTYIPLGTAVGVGLPDLGQAEVLGLPIKALVLFISASVAGAGGLLAFLSQSFGRYMTERAGEETK